MSKQQTTTAINQKYALILTEQVLAHKKLIDAAKSGITRIQSALIERQELIAQAQKSIPVTPDRQQERNDIMADIALGNAKATALQAIDERIANETAVTQAAKEKVAQVIADTQAALDGLFNKLAIAQASLKEIESKTDDVAHHYFMGMAEIAAAQYVNHALAIKALYIKLSGLNVSIQKHGGKDVKAQGANNIQIPKFNLPQFDGLESFPPTELGMVLNGDFFVYGDYFRQAANKEGARFDALLQD